MSAHEILNEKLIENKKILDNFNTSISYHTGLIENLRRNKQELEASIKDIELALSVLRKM